MDLNEKFYEYKFAQYLIEYHVNARYIYRKMLLFV